MFQLSKNLFRAAGHGRPFIYIKNLGARVGEEMLSDQNWTAGDLRAIASDMERPATDKAEDKPAALPLPHCVE